jgi:hypothetical protein
MDIWGGFLGILIFILSVFYILLCFKYPIPVLVVTVIVVSLVFAFIGGCLAFE